MRNALHTVTGDLGRMRRGSTTGSLTWRRLGRARAAKSHLPFRVLASRGAHAGADSWSLRCTAFPPFAAAIQQAAAVRPLGARRSSPSCVEVVGVAPVVTVLCAALTRALACVGGCGARRRLSNGWGRAAQLRVRARFGCRGRDSGPSGRPGVRLPRGRWPVPGPLRPRALEQTRRGWPTRGGVVAHVVGGRRTHVVGDRHALLLPPGSPFVGRGRVNSAPGRCLCRGGGCGSCRLLPRLVPSSHRW